jgi:hypothetical protein
MYVHNMDGTHKDKATWTKEKESTKVDGRLEALFYACSGSDEECDLGHTSLQLPAACIVRLASSLLAIAAS